MSLYYGVGQVPKGKRRATFEEAKKAGQLRYYGEIAVNPAKLASKEKKLDLLDEQLRLRRYQDNIGILLKEIRAANAVLNDPKSSPSKLKVAQKKKESVIRRHDLNKARIAKQKAIVENLKKENVV